MLFAYTYVPHQMEKMQKFINFIFYQVWCRARKTGAYDLGLFDANPDLKEVMTSFAYDHTKAGDKFSSQVQAIYESFAKLSHQEVAEFKRWYQGNNNIPQICAKDPNSKMARYQDVAQKHETLSEQLGTFFKGLYSQSLLDLAALRAKIGEIDDHYQTFMQTNKAGACPFCGISDLLGEYHSKREAYDHYLPKAIYPFNSINFKNLVPACHHCNSSYKTSKDPAYTPKDPTFAVNRRAVFYPYTTAPHVLDIQVKLLTTDIANLAPENIALAFGPAAVYEQIETWKDVYGIEERYKAKLCTQNGGMAWLIEVMDEWRWHDETAGEEGKAPAAYLRDVNRHAQRSPFANTNFLKKPFLDACQAKGLFDVLPELPV